MSKSLSHAYYFGLINQLYLVSQAIGFYSHVHHPLSLPVINKNYNTFAGAHNTIVCSCDTVQL